MPFIPPRVSRRLPFLLARRYLVARREVSLITVITGLSVVGVAVGVAALVIVLSVMNGFFGFARDVLVSLDPHVRVVCEGGCTVAEADSVRRIAIALPQHPRATAYVEGKAMIALGGAASANKVVVVRGVEPGAFVGAETLDRTLSAGALDLARRDGQGGLLLGTALANRLGLIAATPRSATERRPSAPSTDSSDVSRDLTADAILDAEDDALAAADSTGDALPDPPLALVGGMRGSDVSLLSAQGVEAAFAGPFAVPGLARFELRGVFEMEAAYDESHAFIALDEAQRLFRTGDRVTGLDLRLPDLDDAPAVQRALTAALAPTGGAPSRYRAETWYDLHKGLYGVMRLEKFGASLILMLIVVVAAFNIVGALMMIVIEKRRDVGVLAAMGLSRAGIRRVFLLEGLLIGLVGTGLGLAFGLGAGVRAADDRPRADAGRRRLPPRRLPRRHRRARRGARGALRARPLRPRRRLPRPPRRRPGPRRRREPAVTCADGGTHAGRRCESRQREG